MPKEYKIKRTRGNIYQKNRNKVRSPLAYVGAFLLVAALVAVGWFVYPPVYDLITGNGRPSTAEPAPEPSSQPETPVSQSKPEPAPEPENAPVRAVYAPTDVMLDATRLEALLQQASSAGYNAVLFDAKDANGLLLYNSANEQALSYTAVSPTPFDLGAVVTLMEQYKMRPVARLYAFKDHTASRAGRSMAVIYENQTGTLWLDNYADKGGRPWLNPYNTAAQDYNIAIARECVDSGVPLVIAAGVQFPTASGGLDKAGYGDTGGKSKNDVLKDYVTRLDKAVTDAGGALVVEALASSVLDAAATPHFGTPEAYSGLAVNSMPAVWGTGGALLNSINPVQDPYGTQLTVLRSITGKTQARLIPFVQAYTDNNAAAAGKQYTNTEVKAQLDALRELSIQEYIVYNPEGKYPF